MDVDEVLQQAEKEQERTTAIKNRVSSFQNSFLSSHGTGTLDYLSKFCLEHSSTFVPESARKSDFNEGARSVIIEIRRWLNYDLSKLER